jgi:hypothetical protein
MLRLLKGSDAEGAVPLLLGEAGGPAEFSRGASGELLWTAPQEPEEPAPEPEPEVPLGPMAEFDEAAVLAWLASAPGLTAAQRVAAAARMAEDEYDGVELAAVKPKTLLRCPGP